MERENIWVECMYNTNGASLVLTVGKQYLATIIDEHTYRIENDKGEFDWFSKNRFKIVNKTPNLSIIKTNMRDDLKEIREKFVVNISFFNQKDVYNKVEIIIEESLLGIVTDIYTISSVINENNLLEKANLILKHYDIKLELDQPKYKINCDKVYTKEEADKLRESGIDLVEVKNNEYEKSNM